MGAAWKTTTKGTTAAPKKEDKAEIQQYENCRKVRVFAAAAPDGRDLAAVRREQLASNRMKAHNDRLANSAGFQEGNQVWLYRPTRAR
jgi:hypothetical protein